ncbi:hypothetical protein HYW18_00770 [Candidatus Uhrbacteria bacterium]|nr:hypothetical protein [Candidatus Uhrbacteria bacterium]
MKSKTPNFDERIEELLKKLVPGTRVCKKTGETWELTQEEIEWCRHFRVPPSDVSPLARLRMLTAFFVGYQWWNNKSAKDGRTLVSSTHPASGVKILPDEEWLQQDFSSLRRPIHSDTSVFRVLQELSREIPFMAFRNAVPPENSISTISMGDQNSYFMNACRSKNSFFGMNALDTEDSAEVYQSGKIVGSYNVVHAERLYQCRFVQESRDCMSSAFLFDCRDCEHCFMATNKRRAKYVWKNEQLSRQEYEKRIAEVDLSSRVRLEAYKTEFLELIRTQGIWPENFNEKAEQSSGEYLQEVTNCHFCYNNNYGCRDQLWCAYMFHETFQNAFDVGLFYGTNNCWGCSTGSRSANCLFSYLVVNCQRVEYSMHCYDCENCFGCVGLNRKKFHIFNTPCTEEEYYRLLDEIKCGMLERREYGEFLPATLSPTRFLDSGAALFLLADEVAGRQLGALEYAPESAGASGDPSIVLLPVGDIPDSISDPSVEALSGKLFFDESLDRRFTFLKPEVEFYRAMKIGPPRDHFIARVRDLSFRANSGVFEDTICAKCSRNILVTKNKTFPSRTIYCRACYQDTLSA